MKNEGIPCPSEVNPQENANDQLYSVECFLWVNRLDMLIGISLYVFTKPLILFDIVILS